MEETGMKPSERSSMREELLLKISCGVFFFFSIVPLCASDAVKLPDAAGPGSKGYVKGGLIYPLDDKPTPECHASTIAEIEGGLIAAWFGGAHERAVDVGIWVSRCVGGTWSKPFEVVDGSEGEEREYPCWNPVLFQPKEGPLMLFYKVGPSPRSWWGMLITSKDNGRTWSSPRRLGTDPKLGKGNPNLIGPVKNPPVQLNDGTILCPSSTEHDNWRTHFECTKDGGKTWEVIGPINDGKTFGTIQATILTYSDGKMQALCRSRRKPVVSQTWSTDGGKTWSGFTATPLPNPNAGVCGVTLSSGRQLLVYNHTTRGRAILNVALSKDGKEWTPVLTLEKQRGEYSYPTMIQSSDGKVHITYTYRRRSVKHVVLDPEEL